jgi:hypothetical protein
MKFKTADGGEKFYKAAIIVCGSQTIIGTDNYTSSSTNWLSAD